MNLESINPKDNSLIHSWNVHNENDIDNILEKASKAYLSWKNTDLSFRIDRLDEIANLLRDNSKEYGTIMADEMGKPLSQGISEIEKCAWLCDYYRENAKNFLNPKNVETGNYKSLITFQPIGLVLGVMPWNFPFWQVFRFAIPSLLLGNGIVLKHASNVQGCANAIEKCFLDAGFFENIFRNLQIPGSHVKYVIENKYISAITLTGSTPAGKSVAKTAGDCLKKTVLELGGSDPYVIFDDADIENAIKLNESKMKSLNRHKSDLDKFEYDENCEYCVSNGKEQINEQEYIQNKIKELNDESDNLNVNYKLKSYALEKLGNAEKRNQEFKIFSDELNQISHDAVKIGGKIDKNEATLKHTESEITNIESSIRKYYELEEKIESNNKLNEKISKITGKISELGFSSIELDKKYKKILSTLSVARNQKEQIEDDIQKLVDIEQKILDYDLYLLALSKDGIPYELITRAIPAIEREINYVLENMNAGFHIELEMKDKMIDAYIVYGDHKWNLELSSGMERFVSALAIRIGLINVSTLPRPNFIIVDEGFGSLDSDNIANMQGAFQYLRTQFDFTMVITHLDTIKDYMDILIPIDVSDKGISRVQFV